MPRIVYLVPNPEFPSGGNKMAFRHVEALVSLGFDAVVRAPPSGPLPRWFRHEAPVERTSGAPRPDDILVFPDDAAAELNAAAALPNTKVVFVQNPYSSVLGLPAIPPERAAVYRTFMTCSDGVSAWVRRYVDHDEVATVPAFADERLFRPAAKARVIACTPRKRHNELRVIRHLYARLRPGCDYRWALIDGRTEAETASALASASVFLSLARLEGMSLTIAEAMASGCLIAGFTGLGAREYANADNGLWVGEDDCEAAAHALVRAVELAEAHGPEAGAMRAGALAAAGGWTHAAFVRALDDYWRARLTLCKS